MKMSENGHNIKNQTHCQKKIKAYDSSSRIKNRVTCGADIVIGHVFWARVAISNFRLIVAALVRGWVRVESPA